ncbi:hypothetical protein ANO11243_055850 [Dothideomycetidae sp. 11243]|nr:hypothetical protein ANO11243_055850 [fungal sp. No.11243]
MRTYEVLGLARQGEEERPPRSSVMGPHLSTRATTTRRCTCSAATPDSALRVSPNTNRTAARRTTADRSDAWSYQRLPPLAALTDSRDNLHRALQVNSLRHSTILVLDKSLCIDFTSMRTKIRNSIRRMENIFFQRTGPVHSDLGLINGRHIFVTNIHLSADDPVRLLRLLVEHSGTSYSTQPCPHLSFINSPHRFALLPAATNCIEFGQQMFLAPRRAQMPPCAVCSTTFSSAISCNGAESSVTSSARYDLCALKSPLEPQWARLAGKIPDPVC